MGAGGSHPWASSNRPAQDGDEGPNLEGESEEGERAQIRRAPKGPTKREREEHEATHIPYRSWCRHCVRGRATNRPHVKAPAEEDEEEKLKRVPRISMDYFFMGQDGERAAEYPMIVMIDESTDNRYMRAVERKGLGDHKEMEWLILDMSAELKSWGYSGGSQGELIFKSDGEPSIVAIRDSLAKYHGGRITPEQPPPGESQANGKVEEAGKTTRSYIRVLKDMVEHRTGRKMETNAIVLQWLVRWAAMLHSRYRRGADGKTAYERQRGRKCRQEVIPFGESVHYRKLEEDKKNKLDSKWEDGVWLGHARGSNECLIGTPAGVVRAWAIKRRPEEERWCADNLEAVQGTPARPNPNLPGRDIPVHIYLPDPAGEVPEPAPERAEEGTRRTYLKKRDFEKHGYTDGCEGCRRLRTGGMGARPHTQECRDRLEEKLKEEDNPRWRRAKEAADERMWEEVKKQDPEAAKVDEGEVPDTGGASGSGEAAEDGGTNAGETRGDGEDGPESQKQRGFKEAYREEASAQPQRETLAPEAKRSRPAGEEEEPPGKKERRERKRNRPEEIPADEQQQPRRRRGPEDPGRTEIISALLRVDVAEVYLPPVVTKEAHKFGLERGEAMDITTGWDFRRLEDRDRAKKYLEQHKPRLLIGSPMCASFSPLQRFNPQTAQRTRKWEENRRHIEFVTDLYRQQVVAGRHFLHQHPDAATSWGLQEVQRLEKEFGLHTVKADQCMFGQATRGARRGTTAPARKRTRFMTTSYHIAKELDRRCAGAHSHQRLTEGRAAEGPRFTPAMCRAICRGLIHEKACEAGGLRAVAEVSPCESGAKVPDADEFHEVAPNTREYLSALTENGAWDDATGLALDRKRVQKARAEEIEYVRSKNVWTKITRAEAQRQGMRIIKSRWIDINKGDDQNPVYRSRFVAKEYNTGEEPGLFAGTPPLEALRYLVHLAATQRRGGEENRAIMINDVARAFFEAEATRKVCVEIPEEDKTASDEHRDMVGRLNMSLYGTRDAARNWQDEVARSMRKWGFCRGTYNPCLFYHPCWEIATLVHGDDFVSTGDRASLQKFRRALEARYQIKTQVIGDAGGEEVTEARALNRVIRITQEGWEYEPDQRHVDLLVSGLGLGEAKGVATPGEDSRRWEEAEDAEELDPANAKKFRGHAARLNYLAADRPDISYSAKEICRHMAKPTRGGWKKLKRVVRYLLEHKRTVLSYPWQGEEEEVVTFSDSDWAGCRVSGKSTSGGTVLIGEHYIKGWASTQLSIALSSGEAELVALVKATSETMGIVNMVKDLGGTKKGVVYADSSAALSAADRKGSGKLRHINIRMLWIQEREQREDVELRKVRGEVNPADMNTKYLAGPKLMDFMRRFGQHVKIGRAGVALDVQGKEGPGGVCRTDVVDP